MGVREWVEANIAVGGVREPIARCLKGTIEFVYSGATVAFVIPVMLVLAVWIPRIEVSASLFGATVSIPVSGALPIAVVVFLVASYREYDQSLRCTYLED